VLSILVQIHQYLIAKFNIDGFRIDTVKYIRPDIIEQFGNAIREFALSIGKKNFFTYGEVFDSEKAIAAFTGRNSVNEGFGIDAALDFPLFYKLPGVAKHLDGGEVESIRKVFQTRKKEEEKLLSSHGEASRFFVTFLENHDQAVRFNHPAALPQQVTLGLTALFCLQGIPCLYYGTEQGLDGTKKTVDGNRQPDVGHQPECVREALWGKENAFDENHPLYKKVQELSALRQREPALRYGRQYFREVSVGDSGGFGQSYGKGGVLAFSRILNNREVLVVANTDTQKPFNGLVLIDSDLNPANTTRRLSFSNLKIEGEQLVQVEKLPQVQFYNDEHQLTGSAPATAVRLSLQPMEVQVITPEFQMIAPETQLSKVELTREVAETA
jgi:glycosidase